MQAAAQAAKEKMSTPVFSLAASAAAALTKSAGTNPIPQPDIQAQTRIRGFNSAGTARICTPSWLSSTSQWASTYSCDPIALASLVQRYYANNFGRFMSPDPYKASGGTSDPQSWNRYAYVEGDPVNYIDPQGMDTCWVNGDPYECWPKLAGIFVAMNGPTPAQIGKGNPPGTKPVPYPRVYLLQERAAAKAAFNDLGPGCKKALGKLWDLGSDPNGVLSKIDHIAFLNGDRTGAAGGVSDALMWMFGYSGDYRTVSEYFKGDYYAAFVSESNGKPSNEIVLGPGFIKEDPADQAETLVHEVLHSYTGMGDSALATALGLPLSGYSGQFGEDQASMRINSYLQADCDKSKMQ